jgi:hypothetical protein
MGLDNEFQNTSVGFIAATKESIEQHVGKYNFAVNIICMIYYLQTEQISPIAISNAMKQKHTERGKKK